MLIAPYIDHTLLSPTTSPEAVQTLCAEAVQYGFAAVCIPPFYVTLARHKTRGSNVKVATVAGFPLGYASIEAKYAEIKSAIADGADELDMVVNLCALKSGDWNYLEREILTCIQPVRLYRKTIKVIIETGELTDAELIKSCEVYAKYKVDFVKTSTGYAAKGADTHTIELLRAHLPENIQIKASGGIRTLSLAEALIKSGATRLGTSAGMSLIKERENVI